MSDAEQTLADWLSEQIAEDEAAAQAADGRPTPIGMWDDERVLAVCKVHRHIVETHSGDADEMCQSYAGNWSYEPCPTLRILAAIYADRDGWRPEWRL